MRMEIADFRREFSESAALRRELFLFTHLLMIQIAQTAACNRFHEADTRLSRWLLQSADRMENETVRLTHEFLSQMLGVRRTTVTVVANVLQQAGLIRYHRGQIEIVDRQGLEARACECYEAIRRQIDQVAER
jgi:CRP-like cAMP-binding protein